MADISNDALDIARHMQGWVDKYCPDLYMRDDYEQSARDMAIAVYRCYLALAHRREQRQPS